MSSLVAVGTRAGDTPIIYLALATRLFYTGTLTSFVIEFSDISRSSDLNYCS